MSEGKVIDINKGRKKFNYKKILSVLKIPIIILAVIAALILSARLVGKVAMSNITDSFRQIKTVFSKGKGFPYSIEGLEIDRVEAIGNRILILTDDDSLVLDSKAGELYKTQLFAEETKVVTHNGRALLYSENSPKVVMQSKTEELGSIEENGSVITATIAKNGWFATSHANSENLSVLTVYNNHFEKEFVWNCSNERIAAIALTPDGKGVAVSAVGVENAEVYSRILFFNTEKTDPVYDSRVSGTLFLNMFYPSENTVVAVGDNKTLVLGADGNAKETLTYTETGLLFAQADEKGNVAVSFSDFGGFESQICVYDKEGARLCALKVAGKADALDIGSKRIAYVFNNELKVYELSGEEKESFQVGNDVKKLMICSGDFFTVEGERICKYK